MGAYKEFLIQLDDIEFNADKRVAKDLIIKTIDESKFSTAVKNALYELYDIRGKLRCITLMHT